MTLISCETPMRGCHESANAETRKKNSKLNSRKPADWCGRHPAAFPFRQGLRSSEKGREIEKKAPRLSGPSRRVVARGRLGNRIAFKILEFGSCHIFRGPLFFHRAPELTRRSWCSSANSVETGERQAGVCRYTTAKKGSPVLSVFLLKFGDSHRNY